MAHAESSGSGVTGIVAIVAIVLLVALGFFVFRGSLGRRSGGESGVKGSIELKTPSPSSTPAPAGGQR
jgi:hypothetical protein